MSEAFPGADNNVQRRDRPQIVPRSLCTTSTRTGQHLWPTVSGGADSVDELCPSGFEALAVTGDRWLGEFGGCELQQQGSV